MVVCLDADVGMPQCPLDAPALSAFPRYLRAVVGGASAEVAPEGIADAGTAIDARRANDHAHGPHGALPDCGIHNPPQRPLNKVTVPARQSGPQRQRNRQVLTTDFHRALALQRCA